MREQGSSGVVVVCLLLAGCSRNTSSVDIGPSGGTVELAGKNRLVSLRVPAGAVEKKLSFSLRSIPRRLAGAAGPAIEAMPHGTTFAKPVALRFTPKPSELARGVAFTELRVATLNDGRWELLPTSFPAPGVIEGLTTHFSTFALVAPCHAAGTGTDFPLVECPTFNPHITTSAPVTLNASASNVTLKLGFSPTAGGTSPVTVNISGLTPNWTYHLLRDAQLNPAPMTADAAGELHFSQDTGAPHLLVLMAQHGSVALSSTTCVPPLGSYTAATSTCTLMQDYSSPPISIVQNGLTLDCKDAATGLRHVIGNPGSRLSNGIYVFGNTNVRVRDCDIVNVDLGVLAATSTFSAERVSVSVAAGLDPGGTAFDTNGGDNSFTDLVVDNYQKGVSASQSQNFTVRRASLRATSTAVILESVVGALVEDVTLDGTLSGPGPANPADPVPTGAIGMSQARDIVVRRLTASQMTAFDAAVAAVFDSTVHVEAANITGARRGVRLDGPGLSQVSASTLTGNREGLAVLGGSAVVFHNNIHDNTQQQVFGAVAAELSDTRPDAGTFGEGNFWGRGCPGALFVAGTDSNAANVVDSHPFGSASAWTGGGVPGCAAVLAAPVLILPVQGAFVSTATPAFEGTSAAGATVELFEGATLLGSAVAGAGGTFAIAPLAPFSDGPHDVFARARLNGTTSPASTPLSFTVDTVAPPAPTIDSPIGGATLTDSSIVVAGAAEPGADVSIYEGATLVSAAVTDLGGAFIAAIALGQGQHTISAVGQDEAGNSSARSAARTFSVIVPSTTAPLTSLGGDFRLTSVRDAPDPFIPSLGEVNTVRIEGEVLMAPGAQGNHVWQAGVRREILQLSTGLVVASSAVTAPVVLGPGKLNLMFDLSTGWPAPANSPAFPTPGPYQSQLTVWIVRDPLGAGTPPGLPPAPGGCGPAGQPVSGPCKFDELRLLNTFAVLERPRGATFAPPLVVCAATPEQCNGLDDNCNGTIDEGEACAGVQQCAPHGACSPHGCNGVTCGSIPDGCGGTVVCGGTCP